MRKTREVATQYEMKRDNNYAWHWTKYDLRKNILPNSKDVFSTDMVVFMKITS